MVVRDLGDPRARLVEIELPDGRSVSIAEHLCGWTSAADPEGPLWPTVADAVRALTGRTRDGEAWISVLEEFTTSLGAAPGEPLPPAEEERLQAVLDAGPGVYYDGPRAHGSGGWYMFIGGLPFGAWVLEYGDSPADATRAALVRAEGLLGP